jgi:predicted protein tyrosine phosphatase
LRKTRILFVCLANVDRSPTAEDIFRSREDLEVLSAGISAVGGRQLTEELVNWADKIFVMETEQADYLKALVPGASSKTIALNIPDIYRRNHPKLIMLLRERVTPHLP